MRPALDIAGCRVGLAHRRLAIIDPRPEADQPMSHGDGGYRSSSTARSSTIASCAPSWRRRAITCRTTSDTEVLLLSMPLWRDMVTGCAACSPSPSGTRRGTVCSPPAILFGIRPFYFAEGRRGCASLRRSRRSRPAAASNLTPDPAGRVGFFLFGYVPGPSRSIANPGPAGRFTRSRRRGGVRLSRYFDIAAELAEAAPGRRRPTRQSADG